MTLQGLICLVHFMRSIKLAPQSEFWDGRWKYYGKGPAKKSKFPRKLTYRDLVFNG